ncbi:regulator of G-protein signaling 21 isoform X1 [Sander lucioperca]|uniref:regulator of G-protein signaling 21 isoform X1 n=1 Tax=Sander lucioperca TaxID=283035 RepID=UPI0016534F1E|nr:regulator of G-protein signaling 21 isoform X1 [Sander lucioperca]
MPGLSQQQHFAYRFPYIPFMLGGGHLDLFSPLTPSLPNNHNTTSVWQELISVSHRRGRGDGDKVSYCIFDYWAFTIFSRQQLTAAMWKIPRMFSLTGRLCCFPKDPLGDVETWSESVDKVLSCKAGQIAFREFLKSEYSEENILFWLACEEYKKIKTVPEMISSANRIYSEFVQTEAPRQINIDCGTRENITKNISQPSLTSFDTAQKLIYSLMARDCYPRFLKSDIYQGLLRRTDSR